MWLVMSKGRLASPFSEKISSLFRDENPKVVCALQVHTHTDKRIVITAYVMMRHNIANDNEFVC